MSKNILGIDIGGTKISAAIVNNGVIASDIQKIETPKEIVSINKALIDIVKAFKGSYTFDTVGIATAGVVDTEQTKIISATPNLCDNYNQLDYKEILACEFGMSVFMDNDANAAAYGEYKSGAGKGFRDTITITIGTGIGAGIIINNKIHRGKGFSAGECGHMPITNSKIIQCNCGSYDCWEVYASGNGLVNTAKYSLSKTGMDADLSPLTTYSILEGLKNNDSFCSSVYHKWHDHLACGITCLIRVISPECLILGGSMAEFIDFEKLSSLVESQVRLKPEIRKAQLGNNAGIIGISELARDSFLDRTQKEELVC